MSSGNVHSAEAFLQFSLVPGLVQLSSYLVPNLEMWILQRPFHNLGLVQGLVLLGSDLVPCWEMWFPSPSLKPRFRLGSMLGNVVSLQAVSQNKPGNVVSPSALPPNKLGSNLVPS